MRSPPTHDDDDAETNEPLAVYGSAGRSYFYSPVYTGFSSLDARAYMCVRARAR